MHPVISKEEVLSRIPQKPPFRFIDEILELDEMKISGQYRFRESEFFYPGHFPGRPLTPGVILLESMAQHGVALGIYLLLLEQENRPDLDVQFLFTDGTFEFIRPVLPGEVVITHAERVLWRHKKFRIKAQMYRGDTLVATSEIAGVGVPGERLQSLDRNL